MDVRLVLESGNTKQQTWCLHHKDTVVGRHRTCDLRILSSEVSRRHCLLHIEDVSVKVEDLDSVNGTFVNGSRVVGTQVLLPGDHLRVGPLEFTVEYNGSAEDERQRSEVHTVEDADGPDAYDVLPLVDEAEASWHLPQTNELRDLLSQLEQPEASPRV
jgi:pSer/pThr/pTyr-binding forkhead associated (FHA) protein